MQSNTSDPLDLDKRKMCNWQYVMPTPFDSVTWTQLQEQIRANIQSEKNDKGGKNLKTKDGS